MILLSSPPKWLKALLEHGIMLVLYECKTVREKKIEKLP
jgi:hypothetical protein